MYIRKQRLLTPGPTPLYPPALHAMMASDMHHRTEDFRKVYRDCLADLKELMGTANDRLMFAGSGTGAMGRAVAKTGAILVVDAITGLGTMPLDIDDWGLDVVIGGSQKAFMIPPGLAFMSISPKAWKLGETGNLPHYYFNLKKEKKSGDAGESSWTPATSLILALGEALKYVKSIGMANLVANAQMLAHATRTAA